MTNAPEITTAAETAVSRAEGLPLDSDLSPLDAAREAIAQLYEQAAAVLCPANLAPVEPGVLADFSLAIAQIAPYESAVPILARWHEQSVDAHPDLAAVIRGPRGQAVVRRQAVHTTSGTPGADVAALEQFVTELARQISVRLAHPLAAEPATIISVTVPALRTRLQAVEQRHAEHAKAEAARRDAEWRRSEAERKERERAAEAKEWAARLQGEDDELREKRRELAAFYMRHATRFTFTIGGRRMTGDEAAANLKAGDEYPKYYHAMSTGEARLAGVAEQAL